MVDIRPQDLNPAVTPIDADSPIIIDQGLAGVNRTTSTKMVNAVAPVASQAEAETGTDDVKRMTALKTKQSIASEVGVSVASYAAGEAGLSAVQSVNGKTGNAVTLVKGDVGLGNVDNTSDVDKPISTAQQTALNLKANAATQVISGSGLTGGGELTGDVTVDLTVENIDRLTKVDGIESGATKNQTDAYLLNRANHTGTQAISTVSGLQVSLDGKATSAQGAKADTALQAAGGLAGQTLVKSSDATNDVQWATVAAATAVSYAPQTLTSGQQTQARDNIGSASIAQGDKADTALQTLTAGTNITISGTGTTRTINATVPASTVTSVNGKAGPTVTLNAGDVGALPTGGTAADSAKLNNQTGAQWDAKIAAAGNYIPPSSSTLPIGAYAMLFLAPGANVSNGGNVAGSRLKLFSIKVGATGGGSDGEIVLASGAQTGTWKNISGLTIRGDTGNIAYERTGLFVRTV